MHKNDTIIVIGRQYGSGGRRLGRLLAEKLDVAYYDKELIAEAARRLGIRADIFDSADERKPSLLRSMLGAACGSPSYFSGGSFSPERVYQLQSDAIRQIMDESNGCVIVGRTADYIGRERDNLVSVFLHAPIEYRITNIRSTPEGEELSENRVRDLIERHDTRRRDYYNYFTGRSWGHADNYHLSFDSSRMPVEKIAEIIVSLICNEL